METVSIVAGVTSVVLGFMAIGLSVAFFRMSTGFAKQADESAKGISASVDRLEKLFDKLYSDTFSMMRDTVTDMRKHMWPIASETTDAAPVAEEERRADARIDQLKSELSTEIAQVVNRVGITDAKVSQLRGELIPLIERAMTESRIVDAEAREETIRDRVLRLYRRGKSRRGRVVADDVVTPLVEEGLSAGAVIREMENMRARGLLYWHPDNESLGPSSELYLSRGQYLRSARQRGDSEAVE